MVLSGLRRSRTGFVAKNGRFSRRRTAVVRGLVRLSYSCAGPRLAAHPCGSKHTSARPYGLREDSGGFSDRNRPVDVLRGASKKSALSHFVHFALEGPR